LLTIELIARPLARDGGGFAAERHTEKIVPAAIKSVVTVPYASLLNAKIIEPINNNHVVIDRHFLVFCMQSILARIKIDENWYLEKYQDVLLAIENDVVPNAAAHYTKHGYFENRMPYRIEVDADWYLEEYPAIITLTQQTAYRILAKSRARATDAQGQRTQQQDISGRSQGARMA
jgi:hypothetical protein